MILGVGIDLCLVERIRRSVDQLGKDWLDEVFTGDEQERLGLGEHLAYRAAVGFAIKEACSKTIGTGFANGVRRQDFLVHFDGGDCCVQLTGAARRRAARLCRTSTSVQLRTAFRSSSRWVSALAVLECGPERSLLGSAVALLAPPD